VNVRRLDLAAVAAALALFLVACDAIMVPTLPLSTGAWLDGVINEWLVWFGGLYVLLVGIAAVAERLVHRG
jgi:hypothetical protein